MTKEQSIAGIKKQMMEQQKTGNNDRAKWLAAIVRMLEVKRNGS